VAFHLATTNATPNNNASNNITIVHPLNASNNSGNNPNITEYLNQLTAAHYANLPSVNAGNDMPINASRNGSVNITANANPFNNMIPTVINGINELVVTAPPNNPVISNDHSPTVGPSGTPLQERVTSLEKSTHERSEEALDKIELVEDRCSDIEMHIDVLYERLSNPKGTVHTALSTALTAENRTTEVNERVMGVENRFTDTETKQQQLAQSLDQAVLNLGCRLQAVEVMIANAGNLVLPPGQTLAAILNDLNRRIFALEQGSDTCSDTSEDSNAPSTENGALIAGLEASNAEKNDTIRHLWQRVQKLELERRKPWLSVGSRHEGQSMLISKSNNSSKSESESESHSKGKGRAQSQAMSEDMSESLNPSGSGSQHPSKRRRVGVDQ